MIENGNEKAAENDFQVQLRALVDQVETAHFRTVDDTGANECAMLIWNIVRQAAGLSRITKANLPEYCYGHRLLPRWACLSGV